MCLDLYCLYSRPPSQKTCDNCLTNHAADCRHLSIQQGLFWQAGNMGSWWACLCHLVFHSLDFIMLFCVGGWAIWLALALVTTSASVQHYVLPHRGLRSACVDNHTLNFGFLHHIPPLHRLVFQVSNILTVTLPAPPEYLITSHLLHCPRPLSPLPPSRCTTSHPDATTSLSPPLSSLTVPTIPWFTPVCFPVLLKSSL